MTPITHDVLSIANRLRQINSRYHVFWNDASSRYEVHQSAKPGLMTMCFVVPHKRLDTRALDHALRTMRHNADELDNEIAAHNAQHQQSVQRAVTQSTNKLHDMLDYARHRCGDVVFGKSNTWY